MCPSGVKNALLRPHLLENVPDSRNVAMHLGVEAHIRCAGVVWLVAEYRRSFIIGNEYTGVHLSTHFPSRPDRHDL